MNTPDVTTHGLTETSVFKGLGCQIASIWGTGRVFGSRELRVGAGVLEGGTQEGVLVRVEVGECEGCRRRGDLRIDIFADDCRILRQIGLVMLRGSEWKSRTAGGRERERAHQRRELLETVVRVRGGEIG